VSLPYGVMSDLHCHAWSAFGAVNKDGVNSRLAEILREVDRCCQSIKELGGNTVVIAGDVFHVRGSVAPSVFNPVRNVLRHWTELGMQFFIVPGNHDLEGKVAQSVASAVQMLHENDIHVFHSPNGESFGLTHDGIHTELAFLPWIPRQSDLLAAIGDLRQHIQDGDGDVAATDLFIHAGIDGVLKGMPDQGLTADKLAAFGFRRVFAGHYHHHAELAGGKVYSIGAPVHHTWGDIGVKAGWLIVDDKSVRWMASHAPSFIEVTGEEDPAELPLIVDGHYVRARIGKATAGEVADWRTRLAAMGAKGVLVQSVPVSSATPRSGAITALNSIEAAVAAYAAPQGPDVVALCEDILSEVRA